MRILALLIITIFTNACITYSPGPPQVALTESQTGRIYFESTDNYGFIRGTSPTPIVIDGVLNVPEKHNGDVIITSHGSGGIRNLQARWEKFLRGHGFATFTLNHIIPRDNPSWGYAMIRVTEQQMASDIFHAAKLLESDPRFKNGNIFHIGWSKGGIAGLATAIEYDGARTSSDNVLIDGYVEFYPYCGLTGDLFSNAKILILHGEKDNWALYEHCVKLTATMQEAGSEIRIEGFEDAHHGFDAWFTETFTFARGITIRDDSPECMLHYTRDKPLVSVSGQYGIGDFQSRKAFLERCASRKVTAGGSPKYREQVEKIMLEFLSG